MELQAVVRFTDRGEAARWCALYFSRLYELPAELVRALTAEFPWQAGRDAGVESSAILREALRLLSQRTHSHNGVEYCGGCEAGPDKEEPWRAR